MTTLIFKAIVAKVEICQQLADSLTEYLQSEDPEDCEQLGLVQEFLAIESNQLEIICLSVSK
jgi:hypothetical protein